MVLTKNNLLDIESLVKRLKLKQGSFVADLGCGAFGYFTFLLAKIVGKSGKIYAVDIIKDNLESIKKRARTENLTQVETIWSNLEVLNGTKIESESLDSALLVNVLHQSNKYIDILKETFRMLKPGALVLIVEWNEIDSPFILSNDRKIDKNDIQKIVNFLGLKTVDAFDAGEYHYGLLLKK
ncbi:hypothetical protein CVU82_03965 [Candidatus Falkowbacteria bacterium HGW-Falkowbacteria-1]|jgi:ubiquinone/menaquinone biosynthesis C-methylase UbiE|uniref:Methyltransferase domain-containing protein n=1 Tax=Candidatus Falkowbacteria bacterium HGW-Falkowbacteria-1 TaxID=2013768 RepID=A0A2N2E901_9BACT|nr:MAG: hypothetical protein CVU82_03965 [Candidatus Falkowbacteria bacterium HGW-Falkowbacteria-1]